MPYLRKESIVDVTKIPQLYGVKKPGGIESGNQLKLGCQKDI